MRCAEQNGNFNIQKFLYSANPYCLPDFKNVFEWSMPFIADKGELSSV